MLLLRLEHFGALDLELLHDLQALLLHDALLDEVVLNDRAHPADGQFVSLQVYFDEFSLFLAEHEVVDAVGPGPGDVHTGAAGKTVPDPLELSASVATVTVLGAVYIPHLLWTDSFEVRVKLLEFEHLVTDVFAVSL